MDVKMVPSWKARLSDEFEKPYFNALIDFVKAGIPYANDLSAWKGNFQGI